MPHAADPPGIRSAEVSASSAGANELSLLDSVLLEIARLRRRSADLVQQTTVWRGEDVAPVAQEFAAIHRRAESGLHRAAQRDQVQLPRTFTTPAPPHLSPNISPAGRMLRAAHELECRCAATSCQTSEIGLEHLTEALVRWRRDLVGLERSAHLTAYDSASAS